MSKQDRRINRTKRDLRKAFIDIAQNKDIKQITVKDILEKADYNRTTFYVHYADKFDLMSDIMNEITNGLIKAIQLPYQDNKQIDLSTIQINALHFIDYVYAHQETFKILFNNHNYPDFETKITESLLKIHLIDVEIKDEIFHSLDKEIYFRMHIKSIIGLLEFWTHKDFVYSKDYIKQQLINVWQMRSTIVHFK